MDKESKTKNICRHDEATRRVGKIGEEVCTLFLQNHGWYIVERNWSCRFGEIDIIARRIDVKQTKRLAFIEVKTHHLSHYFEPFERVNLRKQRKIILSAKCWLSTYTNYADYFISFDIASIHLQSAHMAKIRYFSNAFVAPL